MLMQQWERGGGSYNELILDAAAWTRALPHVVQAVFYPVYAAEGQKQHARNVHADFLRRYRLTDKDVPLVEYQPDGAKTDGGRGGGRTATGPFSIVVKK